MRLEGDRAFAQALDDSTPTPAEFEFVHADGAWHFDLTSSYRVVDSTLQQVAQQTGVPEDQLIFDSVESTTGQHIDESIFAQP